MYKTSVVNSDGLTQYIAFDDSRVAEIVFSDIVAIGYVWVPRFISCLEYKYADPNNGHAASVTPYTGQVVFNVVFEGTTVDFDPKSITVAIQEHAMSFGDVRSFQQVTTALFPSFEYRVEYFSLSSSITAVRAVAQVKVCGAPLLSLNDNADCLQRNLGVTCTNFLAPELKRRIASVSPSSGSSSAHEMMDRLGLSSTPVERVGNDGSVYFQSATGRTKWQASVANRGSQSAATMDSSQSASADMSRRSSHNTHYAASRTEQSNTQQNVDTARIHLGLDVRTTIMVRNIPQDIAAADVKGLLDLACFGMYDFIYLRIDFETNKNVGYAFINFSRPEYISNFVHAYIGRRWPIGTNNKNAECSYATVQGIDCLIEKFRNSAVMDENPDYRPMLFVSADHGPHHRIGLQMPFPEPNNLSKKQRSRDNASTVGLFPPRSAQQSRDDRRRGSQYDRGTPSQMREDVRFGHMPPMISSGSNNQYQGYPTQQATNSQQFPRQAIIPPPAVLAGNPFSQATFLNHGHMFQGNTPRFHSNVNGPPPRHEHPIVFAAELPFPGFPGTLGQVPYNPYPDLNPFPNLDGGNDSANDTTASRSNGHASDSIGQDGRRRDTGNGNNGTATGPYGPFDAPYRSRDHQ